MAKFEVHVRRVEEGSGCGCSPFLFLFVVCVLWILLSK